MEKREEDEDRREPADGPYFSGLLFPFGMRLPPSCDEADKMFRSDFSLVKIGKPVK